MKKIFKYVLIIGLVFSLSSCFDDKEVISNAKKELLSSDSIKKEELKNKSEDNTNTDILKKGDAISDIPEIKKNIFVKENLTTNTFIELDELKLSDLSNGEMEITGKTLLNVDKIEVSFSNSSSEFPDDTYLLKKFKSGDSDFIYRAFSRYQTLDFGDNIYVFSAFSGDDVSKIKLTITLYKPGNKKETIEKKLIKTNISYEKKQIGDDENISYLNLPKSELFGEAIVLDDGSFKYSNIDSLLVKKSDVSSIDCSNITSNLTKSIPSWFYWNTCRDIIKDKGIKFNVIRLSGEEYIYERHYIDYNNSLYGVYTLEKGTGVTSENIKEKNNTLKEKEFSTIKLVDNLFYEIVR